MMTLYVLFVEGLGDHDDDNNDEWPGEMSKYHDACIHPNNHMLINDILSDILYLF